uniref:Unannotated protein n=1 Tax=freshwater metagenome TaxID=449393 RepID=A0A6J5ZID3_9ZZZZ
MLDGNPGFGAANNAALSLAREPVSVLLNPDCVLLDDGLSRLAAMAGTRRALLAPRLLNSDGSLQRSAHPVPGGLDAYVAAVTIPRLLPRRLREHFEPYRSADEIEVGWVIGACVAAPTKLLRELGPFDPEDFLFAEDIDLCLRARAQGVPTIFEPSIEIEHSGGHTSSERLDAARYALQAERRREVVEAQLGSSALKRDDRAQALTFSLRAAAGRDRRRNQMLLRSLRVAQNKSS